MLPHKGQHERFMAMEEGHTDQAQGNDFTIREGGCGSLRPQPDVAVQLLITIIDPDEPQREEIHPVGFRDIIG